MTESSSHSRSSMEGRGNQDTVEQTNKFEKSSLLPPKNKSEHPFHPRNDEIHAQEEEKQHDFCETLQVSHRPREHKQDQQKNQQRQYQHPHPHQPLQQPPSEPHHQNEKHIQESKHHHKLHHQQQQFHPHRSTHAELNSICHELFGTNVGRNISNNLFSIPSSSTNHITSPNTMNSRNNTYKFNSVGGNEPDKNKRTKIGYEPDKHFKLVKHCPDMNSDINFCSIPNNSNGRNPKPAHRLDPRKHSVLGHMQSQPGQIWSAIHPSTPFINSSTMYQMNASTTLYKPYEASNARQKLQTSKNASVKSVANLEYHSREHQLQQRCQSTAFLIEAYNQSNQCPIHQHNSEKIPPEQEKDHQLQHSIQNRQLPHQQQENYGGVGKHDQQIHNSNRLGSNQCHASQSVQPSPNFRAFSSVQRFSSLENNHQQHKSQQRRKFTGPSEEAHKTYNQCHQHQHRTQKILPQQEDEYKIQHRFQQRQEIHQQKNSLIGDEKHDQRSHQLHEVHSNWDQPLDKSLLNFQEKLLHENRQQQNGNADGRSHEEQRKLRYHPHNSQPNIYHYPLPKYLHNIIYNQKQDQELEFRTYQCQHEKQGQTAQANNHEHMQFNFLSPQQGQKQEENTHEQKEPNGNVENIFGRMKNQVRNEKQGTIAEDQSKQQQQHHQHFYCNNYNEQQPRPQQTQEKQSEEDNKQETTQHSPTKRYVQEESNNIYRIGSSRNKWLAVHEESERCQNGELINNEKLKNEPHEGICVNEIKQGGPDDARIAQSRTQNSITAKYQEVSTSMQKFDRAKESIEILPNLQGARQTIRRKEHFHICSFCRATFRRLPDLRRHVRVVHHKNKPFKCPECSKHFGEKSNMLKHRSFVHAIQRQFKCGFCNLVFSDRSACDLHISNIHQETRPKYYCEECGLPCNEKADLLSHYGQFHPELLEAFNSYRSGISAAEATSATNMREWIDGGEKSTEEGKNLRKHDPQCEHIVLGQVQQDSTSHLEELGQGLNFNSVLGVNIHADNVTATDRQKIENQIEEENEFDHFKIRNILGDLDEENE